MKISLRFLLFWALLCLYPGYVHAQGLLISEVLANPNGTDSPFEYVELIATQPINFAATPYAVIFSNNGTATAAGWVAGGAVTYGFNITSGTVNAGDVVYVGGASMSPVGTKLRVINTGTAAGDRLGLASTSGVLGNGGANADAVGVFNVDINAITNSTVPVDAIFFGTGPTSGGAVVTGGTAGYQLPVNDNYNGGKLQNSSFLVTDPASDEIIKATGTFNTVTNTFSTTRAWSKTTTATANSSITLAGSGIALTPSTLNFNTSAGIPSVSQSYTLKGTALANDVIITAPVTFEISLSSGSGFTSTLTVDAAAANNGIAIYVRYSPIVTGPNNGTIINVSGGIAQSVAVQGTTAAITSLTANPASLNFSTLAGTPSAVQTYTLQGKNLTADVTITAPAQFEIASNTAGPFVTSYSLTATTVNAGAVTVYVRYNPATTGTHTGNIANVSNATANVAVSGSSNAFVPIYTIQGSGSASTYENTTVTTQGIVTGYFQAANQLKGFYIQSFPGDGDPQTSDGIFIYDSGFGVNVGVGDLVSVTGNVTEFNTTTEINNVSAVTVISSGNSFVPAVVSLPIPAGTNLEKYEGMYVKFNQTLTVSETYGLGRYGELLLSADGRLINPTNAIDPNDSSPAGNNSNGTSNVAAVNAQQELNYRRSILLDDGSTIQNPALVPYLNPADTTLRTGTTVNNLTGIIDFAFDVYRLQPTAAPVFSYAPRPAVPAIGYANLKVASFNVLNFFNGNGQGGGFPTSRGANTPAEFTRQRTKIIQAIKNLNADVLGLMEVENDGDGPQSAIADLVNGLNIATASGTYDYIKDPVASNGTLGTDEIKVAIIYKTAVLAPYGPARIDTNNAYTVTGYSRRPLTQAFTLTNGEKFSLVVNHMKSKGCTNATGADVDHNDGQGCFNDSRKKEANALLQFIQKIKTLTGDSDVIAIGDFNAYEQEDPIDILRAGGLSNLIADNYSFVFDGQSGSLDHVFVTPSLLAKVTGATKWHINADEPIVKDYNQEFNPAYTYSTDAYRSSDHDPILLGLTLNLPLAITHTPLPANPGNGPFIATATITGNPVFSAKLIYKVNGIGKTDIAPVISGNTYTFILPAQPGSGTIEYKIVAYGVDTVYSPSASDYNSFHFGNIKSANYPLKTSPLLGTYLNTKIYLGGASGLHYIKGSNNEFYTVTDRGPNLDANNNRNIKSDPNADNAKLFALPSFTPEILRLKISGDSLELLSRLPLKQPDGTLTSGLVNPLGFGNSGELALTDTAGTRSATDIWGIDSEGLTEGNNNDFWISEEYGTSIWNVNKTDGKVIKRYAPYANLAGAQPQDAPLDTIFKYRNPNKGLEGVAFAPDGKVYGFIQNTLLFPASDANLKKNTRLHRFVQLDPATGISKTFGYEHDAVPAAGSGSSIKNDKIYIGDAVAINNQEFLILEHGKSATESIARIYKITLSGATPITQAFYASAGNKSFEQFLNAATAQNNGVSCVTKTLFLDLIANGYDATVEKQEGLTIINDSTIAVINDNDFGIISPNADGNVAATGVKTVLSIFTVPQNLRLNLCNSSASITAAGPTTITAGDSLALTVNTPTAGSTVTWKKDGVAIQGANSSTYYARLTGSYTATVNTAVCTYASNTIKVLVNENTLPVINITAPADGATVKTGSLLTIKADAYDADGTIIKVEFFINGAKVGEDVTAPYQYNWISTAGNKTLTAVVTDNKAGKSTSSEVKITVVNNTAPLVAISSPVNNATVKAATVVTIKATATDADGSVAKVEFFVNGSKVGEDASAPYEFNYTSTLGTKNLTAVATDNLGVKTTSAVVTIKVVNNTAPVVAVTSPANLTILSGSWYYTIKANAADADGTISLVEFYVNGNKVGQDATAPYSISAYLYWGFATIKAVATDNNGEKSSNSILVLVLPTFHKDANSNDEAAGTEEHIANNNFTIVTYPNPFASEFALAISNPAEGAVINIFDMLGKLVYTQKYKSGSENLTLGSNLPNGIYTVQVISGSEMRTVKVIKQN